MNKLRVLDLFSGIGGFSLGLERTGGFETVAFCEIEPFPRKVLAKHWPEVPCYEDVRELTAERLAADGIERVDVITGGFPCQDLSTAGKQAGIGEGTRSGLWSEIIRLACELRPSFVIVENVANLLAGPSEWPGRWFGRVLGDLAECGFDAEWENIPAAALGAPHRRERVWLVAYPNGAGHNRTKEPGVYRATGGEGIADHAGDGSGAATNVAHAECRFRQAFNRAAILGKPSGQGAADGHTDGRVSRHRQWVAEPAVGRVADGIPDRAHRLKTLGNSVVPQIPELIGNAILASLADERRAA